MHNIHCNGIGLIFSENLSQNQRFCGETELFRLTYSIILKIIRLVNSIQKEYNAKWRDKNGGPTMDNARKFSVQHTRLAKGIAIIMMVYHHLFVLPERLNNDYISVLGFNGFNLEALLATFSKLCVGIFLFLSGIGLFYSLQKETNILKMYRKVLKKLLTFMINYWIIAIIVFPIGVIRGFFEFDIQTVIGVLSGRYYPVMEWWFVCQYVVLLLISPLFISLFQRSGILKKIIVVLMISLIYIAVKIGNLYLSDVDFLGFIFAYLSYVYNESCVVIFVLGIICARFSVFRFFVFKRNWLTFFINFIVLLAVFTARSVFVKAAASMELDFIFTPLFVFSFAALLNRTRVAKKVLDFFATHSTNIWLTHTFWCYYLGQEIVLLPKYSTLIFLWTLILSVVSSVIVNIIYFLVMKLFFKAKVTVLSEGLF